MARSELHAEVKKHRLCLNCLRPFHSHDKCKTPGCKHCGRKHNTLLHIPKNDSVAEPNKVSVVDTPNAVSTENSGQTINLHCSNPVSNTLEKRKPIALSFVNVMGQDQDIFERFSSFKKLIRMTALVLKFVAYLKLRKCHKPYQIKDIEISDLDKATRTLICMVQAVTFSQEIKDLQYNGKVNKNSKLFLYTHFWIRLVLYESEVD
nr:unnamed protein product [Callosobruchus chinensis]